MIAIRGAEVTFGAGTPMETQALRGVDLAIEPGSFTTLIGSNGAGKSTLLNIVTGDVALDRGAIVMDGVDVTRWPAARRAALVARVFQDPLAGTCEQLSIEENLALAYARGRSRGLRAALTGGRRRIFRDLLARLGLGLEDRLADRMGLLSGGQRQAVSLLMATLSDMKMLLLDEHTAALDPKISEFVLALTDEIIREKALTSLMVTHSMRQALDHGDRTVMLHEGRIVLDVRGAERDGLQVQDLLTMFSRVRGEELADDALLLG